MFSAFFINPLLIQDDLSVSGGAKPRRYSLSSEQIVGPPLSPQSSQASSGSGSETHLDLAGNDTPEMRGEDWPILARKGNIGEIEDN